MAGFFGDILGGIGGLLGDPRVQQSMLTAFAAGGNPQQTAQLAALRNEQEMRRKEAEAMELYRKSQLDERERQRAAEEEQAKRQEYSMGLLGGFADPRYDSKWISTLRDDPNFQAGLRVNAVRFGDPKILEEGGLLSPLSKASTPPAAMQYLLSMGMKPGTPEWNRALQDYMTKAKTSVSINNNMAKPSPGYRWVNGTDPSQGEVYIPGGPADPAVSKEGRTEAGVVQRIDNAFNNYRKALSTFGTKVIPGAEKLILSGSHTDLLMEAKELYKLGVLNGPDLELMMGVVKDPTEVWTSVAYKPQDLLRQLDEVIKPKIEAAKARYLELYGRPYQGAKEKAIGEMSDEELRAYIKQQEAKNANP
jgi:hypothetical protein